MEINPESTSFAVLGTGPKRDKVLKRTLSSYYLRMKEIHRKQKGEK